MHRLMNSAMMPIQGNYALRKISQQDFVALVRGAHHDVQLASYIGYPQTAKFIEELTGVPIPLNRAQTDLSDGDEMLIVKLKYRTDAATKGAPVDVDDFEFYRAYFEEIKD